MKLGSRIFNLLSGWLAMSSLLCPSQLVGQGTGEPARAGASVDFSIQRTSEAIDGWLGDYAQEARGGVSFPLCTDEALVRRVYLDLLGYLPSGPVAQEFVRSTDPEKRPKLIFNLLHQPDANRRLALVIRRGWFPKTDVAPYRYLARPTEEWLARRLDDKQPLSQIAFQLLSLDASLAAEHVRSASPRAPSVLLETNGYQPEAMAGNVTQSFLGVDLECAQCHDHPFDRWSQEEFWQVAAFFQKPVELASADPSQSGKVQMKSDAATIRLPDSDRVVTARNVFAKDKTDNSSSFVKWVVSGRDSSFATTVVELLLDEYLGEVASAETTAAAQELKAKIREQLAELLIETDFDLQSVVAALLNSQWYQLSVQPETSELVAMRTMDGEQIFDSLRVATGHELLRSDLALASELGRRELFGEAIHPDDKGQLSVSQLLELMNGETVQSQISGDRNRLVQALVDAEFINDQQCVETLYWALLTRGPEADEREWLEGMRTSSNHRGQWLESLFWGLMNSVEFLTNH